MFPRWCQPFSLVLLLFTGFLFTGCRSASKTTGDDRLILTSGGQLTAEQGAYDVKHYDLNLSINPKRQSISGTATVEAQVTAPMSWLVLDLAPSLRVKQTRLAFSTPEGSSIQATHEQRGGKLWIFLNRSFAVGERILVEIDYKGRPRIAQHAPWDGAFTWSKTETRDHWIATSCQVEGADLWWPCKDHPSDKPESFTLRIRVPNPLVVAANGRLIEVLKHEDETRTYHWHTAYPISNYNVALNIAPYKTITGDYTSVTGERIPVTFWVLPENEDRGAEFFEEILEHLDFYERHLGPYPFRAEKYGVAETPHLGMEHQSIIAYGNRYRGGPHGYDWLHHHELGHEWWGNLVTAADWQHFWIHEGLCTYMQALYAEEREGTMAYHHALYANRRIIQNESPVVPNNVAGTQEMGDGPANDVYYKGAWVIHMLRYLTGKEVMLEILRRFAYPNEALEATSDGSACRFATTEEFVKLAEEISGQELSWLFDLYLTQPFLPDLVTTLKGEQLRVHWDIPEGFTFPMPIEVEVDGQIQRVDMPEGKTTLPADSFKTAKFDPNMWILKNQRPLGVTPP